MRIKKARIRNFKSIIDSKEINLDDKITAFIGKNEQGKTNFLKSLITINKNYSYNRDDLCYKYNLDPQYPVDPIITLWFTLNEEDKEYFKKLNLNLQNQDILRISKFFDNTYNIYFVDSTSENEIQVGYELWSKDEKKELLEHIVNFLKKNVKLMDRKNEENYLRFITSLNTPEGGFRNDLNSPPSLSATYYAVAILEKMNSLDRIKKEKVIEYILANMDGKSGLFKNGTDLPPTLESTFYAIISLKELGSVEILNKKRFINYILSLQNEDGGFSHKKRDEGIEVESRMDSTYFSVKILKLLNGFEKTVTDKIVRFILDSDNATGGFGSRPKAKADIVSTFYAMAALNEIDDIESIGMIDHRKQFEFIESFENSNDFISNDLSTFYEVMALDNLIVYEEKSLEKIKEAIKNRLLSGKIGNGGLDYLDQKLRLDSTFYSVYVIKTFEDDLEISAYVDMKTLICDKDKPDFDKILNYLKDYKSKYIVDGDIDVVFKHILSDYDKKGNVESKILDYLPNIVYSDDKMDLLSDRVKIFEYKNNRDKYKTIDNLLLISEISIDALISKTGMDRRLLTDAASMKITDMLRKSWSQEKININVWIDEGEIHFSIVDESRIQISPTKRSDGFQWFLSFCINFIAITKRDLGNSILLLDNPGLQLHPSGQKDLLSTLETLSNQNQIIYTTHSPYLLNIEHLEKVRLVERCKDTGTIINEKYYHSPLDSLKPIRDSLGFTLRDSFCISNKTLLVEGQSDKDILEGMLIYLRNNKLMEYDLNHILINSIGGANKMPFYAFFLLTEALKFAVILDNDPNGTSASRELRGLDKIEEKQIITLNKVKENDNITIEDLINPNFYNSAVNAAYKEIFKNKLHADIRTEEIDYSGYGLANKYSRYFNENSLGSFNKIMVARQIKDELKAIGESPIIGEDTIKYFKDLFFLVDEALKIK